MSDENKDFSEKAKEAAKEFAEEAKETAKEFKAGAEEALAKDNKKILAGVLAILLGGFGVHKFILGYNKEGFILLGCTIILGIITCGLVNGLIWVITLVEGIIYLTKSDEEFYTTYQLNKRPWF